MSTDDVEAFTRNPYLAVANKGSDLFHVQYFGPGGYYHYHLEDGYCTDKHCATSVPEEVLRDGYR